MRGPIAGIKGSGHAPVLLRWGDVTRVFIPWERPGFSAYFDI